MELTRKEAPIVFDLCPMSALDVCPAKSPGRVRAIGTNPAFYHLAGMRPFVSLVCSPFHMNVRYLLSVGGCKETLMKMHD